MRRLLLVLVCLSALRLEAKEDWVKMLQGRWTIDSEAALASIHAMPQYAKGDAATKATIDGSLLPALRLLGIEFSSDTISGLNATQHYVVKASAEKQLQLHITDPEERDLGVEWIDHDTLRLIQGEGEIPFLLHRDLRDAARRALPPPTAAQRQQWLKEMKGTWRVDIGGPMVDSMRASAEYSQFSEKERAEAEALWKKILVATAPDLVEFTSDTMRGVLAPGQKSVKRQPMKYELTAIDGVRAYLTVNEQDVLHVWEFERRADGSLRVYEHESPMFDLRKDGF